MKIFKAAPVVLFVSLMASCSSDDGAPANNVPSGPEATYFNYKLDGETIPMTVYGGYISEDGVSVSAGAADGRSFQITFTTYGNLGDVVSFSTQNPGTFPSRINFQYFKKNYFDFDLIYVANGQAKVNFSGKLYDDEYDLESDFSTVEGSFVVNLQEVPANLPGAGVSATVNGNPWHEVEVSQSSGSGGDNGTYWSVNFNSDDEYQISMFINPNTLEVGNYIFDSNTHLNRIVIYKYNPALGYEEQYVSTSGTLNITSKGEALGITVIEGTFTATATHPDTNETITVTNGAFKTAYDF